MQLSDIKVSITKMPLEDQLRLHEEIRESRQTSKEPTTKVKAEKRKKAKEVRKKVGGNPAEIRKLLVMLGEDV